MKSVSPHFGLGWEAMTVGQKVHTPTLAFPEPLDPVKRSCAAGGSGVLVRLQAWAGLQRLSWGLWQQVDFNSRAGKHRKVHV